MSNDIKLVSRYGMCTEEFSSLTEHRVQEILLVATPYDAFILEEDGQLTELIFREYQALELNLNYVPNFTRTGDIEETYALLAERSFDLIIMTPFLRQNELKEFTSQIKKDYPDIPIAIFATHSWELPELEQLRVEKFIDWLFLWQGDAKVLLALIKQVEDFRNAEHDVLENSVKTIILVEDNIHFYSTFLPYIYTEITTQTNRLIAEGLNIAHRLLRLRARPKIMLAMNYEDAWEYFELYSTNILGIISDVNFPRNGKLDPMAGVLLAEKVKQKYPHLPVLLQSTNKEHRKDAERIGVHFLHKKSPNLLEGLQKFILKHFGFGDFIFRLPDGRKVAVARDLEEMLEALRYVPMESIIYHADHEHFSTWVMARTEFELAAVLRSRKYTDFEYPEEIRAYLVETFQTYLRSIKHNIISDFKESRFGDTVAFAKIGSGSMGGKGRGLAFMQKTLAQNPIVVDGVSVSIPQTVVLTSDIFEEFIEENDLSSAIHAVDEMSDLEILNLFRSGRFNRKYRTDLAQLLKTMTTPIAVRSSSILEDSLYQPFAGVYATIMLPNNHPSPDVRLAQLLEGLKVVYASTYFKSAREYLATTPRRSEEEKMAVLLQSLVGHAHDNKFYPVMSGVASSYNYYPFGDIKPEDGVALIALGLGKSVVEGFEALRFCPRFPEVLPQFSTVDDILKNAQRHFYALELDKDDIIPGLELDSNLLRLPASEAFADGAANYIASTFDPRNEVIRPGVSRRGTPLITFSRLLKGEPFPLAEIITKVLEEGQKGMGKPIEIEFAVDFYGDSKKKPTFHLLQMRPMVVEQVNHNVEFDDSLIKDALIYSKQALGHGAYKDIFDIVLVDPRKIQRAKTPEIAIEIGELNAKFKAENKPYILIGPGRWGSRDHWLGIPVSWAKISAAKVIVETDFQDLEVDTSQGSHFFHNITCFGTIYFSVTKRNGEHINWDWFEQQPYIYSAFDEGLRHIRLGSPLHVLINGSKGEGIISQEDLFKKILINGNHHE